jgi:phage replication initiation protein
MSGITLGDGWGVDWIAFTLPIRAGCTPYGVAAELGQQFGGLGAVVPGRYGYSCMSSVLGSGWVMWAPERPDQGVHCVLPASALERMAVSLKALDQVILWDRGHYTRIDLWLDSYTVPVSVVAAAVRDRQVVSHFRRAGMIQSLWSDGCTVSLGSRQSDSYVRIYDKRAEQLGKGLEVPDDVWTRCELESKGDRADAVMRAVMAGDSVPGIIQGVLDFRDRSQADQSNRCDQLSWWAEWLQGCKRVVIQVARQLRDMDQWRAWIERQAAQTLGCLLVADGGSLDWLVAIAKQGWQKAPAWKRDIVAHCTPAY